MSKAERIAGFALGQTKAELIPACPGRSGWDECALLGSWRRPGAGAGEAAVLLSGGLLLLSSVEGIAATDCPLHTDMLIE